MKWMAAILTGSTLWVMASSSAQAEAPDLEVPRTCLGLAQLDLSPLSDAVEAWQSPVRNYPDAVFIDPLILKHEDCWYCSNRVKTSVAKLVGTVDEILALDEAEPCKGACETESDRQARRA